MVLSDLSIRRPVFATVIVLALVTLGAFSLRKATVTFIDGIVVVSRADRPTMSALFSSAAL